MGRDRRDHRDRLRYAAVEEAEYATLDAILARREAEELALAASR